MENFLLLSDTVPPLRCCLPLPSFNRRSSFDVVDFVFSLLPSFPDWALCSSPILPPEQDEFAWLGVGAIVSTTSHLPTSVDKQSFSLLSANIFLSRSKALPYGAKRRLLLPDILALRIGALFVCIWKSDSEISARNFGFQLSGRFKDWPARLVVIFPGSDQLLAEYL